MTEADDIERLAPLAEGLLGEVYIAEATPDGGRVALKELTHVCCPDRPSFRQHFDSLARLDHPNLAVYYDWLEGTQVPSFTAELIDGVDLYTYLRRPPTDQELEELEARSEAVAAEAADPADQELEEPDASARETPADRQPQEAPQAESADAEPTQDAAPAEADPGETVDAGTEPDTEAGARPGCDDLDLLLLRLEHVLPQIVAALEHLHRFRTPHGNLKPSNILVDEEGRCTLCDFGLLSELQLRDADGERAPSADELAYSSAYWPPERDDASEATAAADLYALGCILFEAITGCRPLGDGPGGVDRFPDRDSLNLSELEPRCPAAWVELVLQLVDPDPDKRAGLQEVREVLERTRARSVDVRPSMVAEKEVFFGRDGMLDTLVDRAKRCVRRGAAEITVLEGRPGYGKTALAERAARWAAQRGWLVLRGRCFHRESLIYQGWDEIAEKLGDICADAPQELSDRLAPAARGASRLFPVLAPDEEPSAEGAETSGGDADPADRRLTAVAAFRRLLQILSEERPLLVLFDDLNWSGWDTASLLADLLAEPEGLNAFVLGTWRDNHGSDDAREDEHTHLLREALETVPAEVRWTRVPGFDDDEARDYVDSTAGHLSEEARARITAVGDRNPLLLGELVFQEHLAGGQEDDTERVTAEDFAEDASVGAKLTRLLGDRLENLSRREEFVLQILSVASLPLSEGLISLVVDEEFHRTGPTGHSVRDLLRRLEQLRLVQPVATHHWERAYTLRHNICRNLVLEDVHEQHYAHLCTHIADSLRRLWPAADELRFEYLLRADRASEALDSAVRSARTAEDRHAYHRAAKVWRWIGARPELAERLTSLEPRRELAAAEMKAGHLREAARLYGETVEAMPASLARVRLAVQQFDATLRSGQRLPAVEVLEEALGFFGERYAATDFVSRLSEWKNRAIAATNRWADDLEDASTERVSSQTALRARLYRRIILHNDLLESRRHRRYRAKLSALAERSNSAEILAWDRYLLAHACHDAERAERLDRAEGWYAEAEALFERTDQVLGRAAVTLQRARLARIQGNFEQAEGLLDRADHRFDRVPQQGASHRYAVGCERARLHLSAGRLDRAIRRAGKVLHLHRGDALAGFRARQILLPAALLAGRTDRAEMLVEDCQEFLDGAPLPAAQAWLGRQRTRLNLALGRPEVAVGLLDVLIERLHGEGLLADRWVRTLLSLSRGQALVTLVHRKRRLGEPRSDALLPKIQAARDRLVELTDGLTAPLQAEIDRFVARVELLVGRPDRAVEAAERAIDRLGGYPGPIARTLCAEAQGLALHAKEADLGTSMIEQSRVLWEHLGLHLPLVLEGWPVPRRHSALRQDAAQ